MTNGDSNSAARIKLDPQFSWVFDKQFLELRNGFVPSDNNEYMKIIWLACLELGYKSIINLGSVNLQGHTLAC
jgi:hypothetical protein